MLSRILLVKTLMLITCTLTAQTALYTIEQKNMYPDRVIVDITDTLSGDTTGASAAFSLPHVKNVYELYRSYDQLNDSVHIGVKLQRLGQFGEWIDHKNFGTDSVETAVSSSDTLKAALLFRMFYTGNAKNGKNTIIKNRLVFIKD